MNRFLITTLLSCAVLLSGCDFDSVRTAVDDFDIIIQLEPIETFAVGAVVDAATGDPVDGTVNVTFDGQDAAAVIDFYSDPVASMTVKGGLLSFGVRNDVLPAPTSPVRLRLHVAAAGYEGAVRNVLIDAKGEHEFEVHLTPVGAVVDGSDRAGAQSWLVDGKTAGFDLATEPSAADGMSASISVEDGSEVFDASGRTLGGRLETDVSYFSPKSAAALNAFPGGFQSADVQTSSGLVTASVVTAGFVNFAARSSEGSRASRFSRPVARTIDIADGMINPRTGSAYQAGDEVSVLQFDEESGAWKSVAEVPLRPVLSKQGAGLYAEYASESTGYQAIGAVVETCSEGLEIAVDRNGHVGAVALRVQGANGNGFFRRATLGAANNTVRIPDTPRGIPVTISIDLPTGEVVEHSLSPSCGAAETLSLPAPTAEPVDVEFSVDLSCTLKLKPPFNATLRYKKKDAPGAGVSAGVPTWLTDDHGRVMGGSLVIPGMYLDETYRFILVTPDETVWEDVTITSSKMHYSVDVPADLCRR